MGDSHLRLEVSSTVGTHISEVCQEMMDLANKLGIIICTKMWCVVRQDG